MKIYSVFAKFVLIILLMSKISFVTAQINNKIKVGLIIDKERKKDSFEKWLVDNLESINEENGFVKYVYINAAEISDLNTESFKYILELDPSSGGTPSTYNYVKMIEKKVVDKSKSAKKKDTKKSTSKTKTKTKNKSTEKEKEVVKYKTIKVPEYHSGVLFSQSGLVTGRLYDLVTGTYMNGFIVNFSIIHDYQDPQLRLDIDKLMEKGKRVNNYDEKLKAIEKKYLNKYKKDVDRNRIDFNEKFRKYVLDKIRYNTLYPFEYPQKIVDVVKKTSKKAKVVQLSGNKYLQEERGANTFVYALKTDDKGYKYYDRIAQALMKGSYYDKNQIKVRFSSKKVLKAWNAKEKMIVAIAGQEVNFVEDTFQQNFTVLPVFDFEPTPLMQYKVSFYLSSVPIFTVLDRGNIVNISSVQELLKSEKVLDDHKSFELRDKLKGADYIVLFSRIANGNYKVKFIESKTGNLLSEIDMNGGYSYKTKVNFYHLIVPAFEINTEVVDIAKASKTKAKKVYIKSMFPLKKGNKYLVYKAENRMVNGENLLRTIEVGELELNDLYSRTLGVAKIKSGGKDILKYFNNGDKLICKPKMTKRKKSILGQLGQLFSGFFDFNFENYENIHTYSDKHVHVAQ